MNLKLLAFLSTAGGSALSALWTFPSLLASAFLVAWGAEAAQFLISQGLALAILAWLQTLPEFAVEAVIAWDAGRDPERAHLAIATLTGAIRLLLGLGWPMVYVVFVAAGRKTRSGRPRAIRLEPEHAVEIVGLVPPLLYFAWIVLKQRFTWVDAVVLIGLYLVYLWVLFRNPVRDPDQVGDLPAISRWAYTRRGWRQRAAIGGLFAVPEMVSTLGWARRVTRAPMALMNLVSSNINQWTVLAAMIPLVYGYSSLHHHGAWRDFRFDDAQRLEVLLTLLQTGLGVMLLAKMEFDWHDATIILVLWLVQFVRPDMREEVAVAYALWMTILAIGFAVRGKTLLAPKYFWETVRK